MNGFSKVNELPQFNKRVLLTGAGFSKNFGGFLARTFRNHLLSEPIIFNNFGIAEKISEKDATFETVLENLEARYHYFQGKGEAKVDYEQFQQGVYNVFGNMHEVIKNQRMTFHLKRLNRFLARFAPKDAELGYVFTLNQDMVPEHYMQQTQWGHGPCIPGITQNANYFFPHLWNYNLDQLTVAIDPEKAATPIPIKHRLNVVKLHGSFNWKDSEDHRLLVIGGKKDESIQKSPLLQSYRDLFREVLNAGEVRLFIIGYSFGDEHINSMIWDATFDSRAIVWVMDAAPYDQLSDRLKAVVYGQVAGYIDEPFSEVFDPHQQEYAPFDKRIESFFDSDHRPPY
jgi:hypothetical protein